MDRSSEPSIQSAVIPGTEGLHPRVQACIRERGFSSLSDAQKDAIPIVISGKNLLLIAPTGTGKTESAMIPVFHRLLESPAAGISALYITPLRSLNRDILARMQWWCRRLDLTIGVRHGDTKQSERRKQALSPPDLLITTPESLQAMFMGSRMRRHLSNVRCVIIDEIHELADSKRGAQLSVALERLAAIAGDFQRIGLSATVGNPQTVAAFMCGERPCDLIQVPVGRHLEIDVRFAGEDFNDQVRAVEECIERHRSVLIFVNTRATAESLGNRLYHRGDVEVHHGSLSRDVRIEAEERFKKNEIRALICTSSMELGIDIGHVDHVLQFGSPREVARLVQRIGRAGHRLDATSRGTILATGFDDLLESLVIARRARAGECENSEPHENAADVLSNQIAAIAIEYGEIGIERLKKIITGSYCFRNAGDLIERTIEQMERHYLIRREDDVIIRKARSRRYLSGNLSMIPDERKVQIYDMVSRRSVGTLDDSFVASWLHRDSVFITKGQFWRVLDLDSDRVTVEPVRTAQGDVPSWEGEQIPVPFHVAMESGRLRRTRTFHEYTGDPEVIRFASEFLDRMGSHPVPSDRCITIESFDEGVVCNICGGHKSNEALARAISILLSARFGTSVGIEVGAYRIMFRLPAGVSALDVRHTLSELDPEHLEAILRIALKRTSLFKWKLVQVAKKFGAIDPDADYEKISLHRLIDLFDGTVIQDETFRELFSRHMDVKGGVEILRKISDGEIAVEIGGLSPIGREGVFSSRDVVQPATIDDAVLNTIRRRLEGEEIILFCMNCRRWKSRTVVRRVPETPVCPLCGARLIAALKPHEEALIPVMQKKERSKTEREEEIRLLRNANIVLSSGKKAVIALAARGVGPDTASRILAGLTEGDAFYREILKAERRYIRTRRFW
ncbi:MAG: DEAD/DEAH box helicase [Methanoculleaceae archaeon]